MESNLKIKEGRFSYESLSITDCSLSILKGNTQGKEINIAINASVEENYVNVNLANQLLIPESSIG